MERLTIPDVILDRGVIQRSIIDAEKVKECAMELYWRLKAVEDAIADEESEEYDLNRLRELTEADRDGRCVVLPLKEGNPVWKIILDPLKNTGYITDGRFKLSDMLCWGKSVFPSPEEAADALKGYLNGN